MENEDMVKRLKKSVRRLKIAIYLISIFLILAITFTSLNIESAYKNILLDAPIYIALLIQLCLYLYFYIRYKKRILRAM